MMMMISDQKKEEKRIKKSRLSKVKDINKQRNKQAKKNIKIQKHFFSSFSPISIIIFGYGRMNRANPNQQNEEKKGDKQNVN